MTMLDPTKNFDGSFRSFDLPPELRDIVYYEAWLSSTSLIHPMKEGEPRPKLYIRARYKQRSLRETYPIPSTLPECCVDKTFLKESLSQFYRNCDWMAQVPGSQHTTNISIGSNSKSIAAGWDMDEELEAIRDEDPLYPN
jgi:hypothetical protein